MLRAITLPSTFFLILLLMVGLFFFIRASVKERIQHITLMAPDSEEVVLDQLEGYLTQRAYRLIGLDRDQAQLTFEGMVQPSLGLALFLMVIVAIGLLCMSLVLAILWPSVGLGSTSLVLLSPLTVWFYWQRAKRPEQVFLKVEPAPTTPLESQAQTFVTVTAHRDELKALKSALHYQPVSIA
jgi:Flp pilus assembly protein TadB